MLFVCAYSRGLSDRPLDSFGVHLLGDIFVLDSVYSKGLSDRPLEPFGGHSLARFRVLQKQKIMLLLR